MPRTGSADGPHCDRLDTLASGGRLSRTVAVAATLSVAAFTFFGCASVLGIDEDYVLENSAGSSGGTSAGGGFSTGATGNGGSSGKGGAPAASGGKGAGGHADTGGSAGAAVDGGGCTEGGSDCPQDMKCCNGTCVKPAPLVGCGLDTCAQCDPPPPSGTIACLGNECTIQCNPSYVLDDASGLCEPAASNTGGTAGTGGKPGTGGAPAVCAPANCGECVPVGAFKCCKNNNECGCTWAPGAYCL